MRLLRPDRLAGSRTRWHSALAALVVAWLLAPSGASARVEESLQWVDYPVVARQDQTLLSAIDRASHLRQNGRVFHGYTDWHIEWRFRWQPDNHGVCRLVDRTVKLRTTITLPRLDTSPQAHRSVFEVYLKSLRTHEVGHYDIARRAAHDLDKALGNMEPMPICADVERTANQIGNRHLELARRLGNEYDRQTNHGASQGAKLSR